MKKLGLIGFPLSHSFSANYFSEKFEKESIEEYTYTAYPLKQIEDFPALLNKHPEITGLNVTIPYKEQIIPYLSAIEETAKKIGAVNVIKKTEKGLVGYNSDFYGFKKSLLSFLPEDFTQLKALVLGTGGASKAIVAVLESLDISYQMVSRNSSIGLSYSDLHNNLEVIENNHLIINCTPLGTYPEVDQQPDLPYEVISKKHYLFDLVYNPTETSFMKSGLLKGAKVKNGYDMLVEQAEVSWEIWQAE